MVLPSYPLNSNEFLLPRSLWMQPPGAAIVSAITLPLGGMFSSYRLVRVSLYTLGNHRDNYFLLHLLIHSTQVFRQASPHLSGGAGQVAGQVVSALEYGSTLAMFPTPPLFGGSSLHSLVGILLGILQPV